MPTLGGTQGRRIPLMPRRRVALDRNRLAWAAAFSAAVHIALILAMIITFPNKPPQEAAAPPSIQVVFQPGAKTATAPAGKKGPTQKAQQGGRVGPRASAQQRVAEAAAPAPPLPPPPAPAPPVPPPPLPTPPLPTPPLPSPPVVRPAPVAPPTPPHEVPPPPRPVVPIPAVKPPPKSVAPKPVTPKPPAPPLPQINLPPPPPLAPPVPTPPLPAPAPPPPVPPVDDSQAEMNLDLPPMPEFAPTPLPGPPPPLPPAPPQRLARRPSRSRGNALGGAVVMNGLSFSGGGNPSSGFTHGMNLTLPQSEQPGSDSDLSVQGDVGSNWMAELEEWVNQRKYYPELAGEMNQQGTVVIRFSVDRAGHVSHLEMVSPTGHALLDQAWLGLFRGADLPPRPHDGRSDIATITASMHFEIIR
jgi:TonB family protein